MKQPLKILTILVCLIGCLGTSCEEEPVMYTITGNLFSSCTETPLTFTHVDLIESDPTSGSADIRILNTTVTNENGAFSLSYEHINSAPLSLGPLLTLQVNHPGGVKDVLIGIPNNQNIENVKVFNKNRGSLAVHIHDPLSNYSVGDTLYIEARGSYIKLSGPFNSSLDTIYNIDAAPQGYDLSRVFRYSPIGFNQIAYQVNNELAQSSKYYPSGCGKIDTFNIVLSQ